MHVRSLVHPRVPSRFPSFTLFLSPLHRGKPKFPFQEKSVRTLKIVSLKNQGVFLISAGFKEMHECVWVWWCVLGYETRKGRPTTPLLYGETEACVSELILSVFRESKGSIGGFVCFDCCCLFVCFGFFCLFIWLLLAAGYFCFGFLWNTISFGSPG